MSHFGLVAFKRPDQYFELLLAPYDECNHNYYEFVPSNKTLEDYKNDYAKFLIQNPSWKKNGFQHYMDTIVGAKLVDGVYGNTYNPNTKYDYYTLDARYIFPFKRFHRRLNEHEFFELNDYRFVQEEIGGDPFNIFVFIVNKIRLFIDENKVWNGVERIRKHGKDTKRKSMLSDDTDKKWGAYMLKRYKNRRQYLKEMLTSYPIAFLTPDGVWHSPGNIGWFASDDFTAESVNAHIKDWKKFIHDKNNKHLQMSQIDCHI